MNPEQVKPRKPRSCSQCGKDGCNRRNIECPVNVSIIDDIRNDPVVRNHIIARNGVDPINDPNWRNIIEDREELYKISRDQNKDREGKRRLYRIENARRENVRIESVRLESVRLENGEYWTRRENIRLIRLENERLENDRLSRYARLERVRFHNEFIENARRVQDTLQLVLRRFAEIENTNIFASLCGNNDNLREKISLCFSKTYTTTCEPEECGICLETTCTVSTNCNHNYCAVCIKAMLLKTNKLKCAYCRCNITTLKTADDNSKEIISGLNCVTVCT